MSGLRDEFTLAVASQELQEEILGIIAVEPLGAPAIAKRLCPSRPAWALSEVAAALKALERDGFARWNRGGCVWEAV